MNKILLITIAIVLIVASFFVGCSLKKYDSTSAEIQNLQKIQRIVWNGSFTVACPIGVVCDENYVYNYMPDPHEYEGVYLSFKPQIVGNYNLQSFKDNFNYVSVVINFPEKSSGSSKAYYSSLNAIKEINFISYENNVLSGEFNFIVNGITTRTPGDCISEGDIHGWCYDYEKVNYNYTLEFHMIVPE